MKVEIEAEPEEEEKKTEFTYLDENSEQNFKLQEDEFPPLGEEVKSPIEPEIDEQKEEPIEPEPILEETKSEPQDPKTPKPQEPKIPISEMDTYIEKCLFYSLSKVP